MTLKNILNKMPRKVIRMSIKLKNVNNCKKIVLKILRF